VSPAGAESDLRLSDIITELMGATNVNLQYTPNPLKRREPDRDPEPSTNGDNAELPAVAETTFTSDMSILNLDPLLTLPMYTEDLSRLPVYEPLHWGVDLHDGLLLQNTVEPSDLLFPDLSGIFFFLSLMLTLTRCIQAWIPLDYMIP